MFIIDKESYTNFPFDCEIPGETIIDEVIVTGTHSAGKTTLLNDYGTQTDLLEEVAYYKIPAGFTANYENIRGVTVPVVIAPEAAAYYAERVAKNNRTVTDQYTIENQIGIESIAKRLIVQANVIAAHLSHRLQPNIRRPHAIVVSDRSQLDGHVYSAVRLPDAEQELIDIAEVAQSTGGKTPHNYSGHPIPYRQRARANAADSFSIAFIAEHSEIPFKASGLRLDDSQFRDQVAHAMAAYYKAILGEHRVVTLTGNRTERLDTFSAHLRTLARYMIVSELRS